MDGKDYSAVPPPPSLSASAQGGSSLDFNDALSKARAIAEKLKQQSSSTATNSSAPASSSYSSGTKRSYNDDDREDYQSSSAPRSYGSYQEDRESKRGAYDSGSSRPSYGNNDYRRAGLGSDDRKPYSQSYGGNTEEYSVPNHMVGLLIGKGGENLKKIERMSGVSKVQFSNDTNSSERQVHLTGEPDQIKIAKDMIRQMVDDAQNNDNNRFGGGRSNDYGASQAGGNSITITIPVGKVGLVIGRGGETIRDFEERSKAKILIASDGSGDVNNERTIKIVGDDAAIKLAKSLVEDIVFGNNNGASSRNWGQQYQHQPYGNGSDYQQQHSAYAPNNAYGVNRMGRPDDERIFVTVPASSVGLIIGRGGETVRSLQEQSGARVKIDPTNDPNSEERTVNISGDPKCVAIAKQLVEEKVAEANRSGGRYGGYNNDGYGGRGGYKSHNQQGYQGGEGSYDYSQQYSQYYSQYGYDQSQYGGQDASAYQQYPGYQYNTAAYGGYNDQIPGAEQNTDTAASGPLSSNSADRKGSEASIKGDDENSKSANNASPDPSAYYAQYYGGGQQATPEQQQAYYQWYQQYYGAQQQYGYDQSQQQDSTEKTDKESAGESENVDGEPIEGKTDDDEQNHTKTTETSKD